ncbi:MAG: hypothetical protein L3J76_02540, partial [Candidatus Hydrothermae bacterium]|nr:hypothetical protein [Candidatus Hydrothermae bacterium]
LPSYYQGLGAPHWTGAKGFDCDPSPADRITGTPCPCGGGGSITPAQEDIVVQKVRNFLLSGNALMAECASIEVFENNPNGRFLTSIGIYPDNDQIPPAGRSAACGTNDSIKVGYPGIPYTQIGDFQYQSTGGHRHNWRPLPPDGDTLNDNSLVSPGYKPTVRDFLYLDTPCPLPTSVGATQRWNYAIGGHIDGDVDKGYVVYVGGHKYAKCLSYGGGAGAGPEDSLHIKFKRSLDPGTVFDLKLIYLVGSDTDSVSLVFQVGQDIQAGDSLLVDAASTRYKDPNKRQEIRNLHVINQSHQNIQIIAFSLRWNPNGGASGEKLDKITTATGVTFFDSKKFGGSTASPVDVPPGDPSIVPVALAAPSGGGAPSLGPETCTPDWGATNVAAVRMILNTMLQLGGEVQRQKFVQGSPVVDRDQILYVGSREYPGHIGHFQAFDIKQSSRTELWDALRKMPRAGDYNSPLTRKIWTNLTGRPQDFLSFDLNQVTVLQPLLVVPTVDSATWLIKLVRGQKRILRRIGGSVTYIWRDRNFRLGEITHSTPAILEPSPLVPGGLSRDKFAFIGAGDGMLHMFLAAENTSSGFRYICGDCGKEIAAYISRHALPYLKYQPFDAPSDPPAVSVDGSPVLADVFVDTTTYGNGPHKIWRTVLAVNGQVRTPQPYGIFMGFDVTELNTIDRIASVKLLFDTAFVDSNVGLSRGMSMGEVVLGNGTETYALFFGTNFATRDSGKFGIHLFALGLRGQMYWHQTFAYQDTAINVNDIPGIPALMDINLDGYTDYVLIGDMEGRLWALNAGTGESYCKDRNGNPVPLFDFGANEPIGAGPTVDGTVIYVGTGGTDWADTTQRYHIYAVRFQCGNTAPLWSYELQPGEKVWESPVVAGSQLLVGVGRGRLNATPPQTGRGRVISLNKETGDANWNVRTQTAVAGVGARGKHGYAVTAEGELLQIGPSAAPQPEGIPTGVVRTLEWREIFGAD